MILLFHEVAPAQLMERRRYSLKRKSVTEWYQSVTVIKRVLQYGIRDKVSTLSLDGLVEWSLDQGFEEKLCLEDQFHTFECS
jgi:hypothetical protein